MSTVPIRDAKAHLSRYVDEVTREHDRVTITRNGRPVAVILASEDLEALEETLDVLSDPEALDAIREAEADYAAGRVLDAEQVRSRYGAR
ncbi:MAG TPA: type II toxin-antitoxin system Phd/YefM family antitoxin [Mycobacteriales bacterium]|nr:type II toxin-antitoxin system Phd/YefM family antitoxin [Mycobacteriales bacterium]